MPIFKDPVKLIKIKGTKNYPDLELTMASTLTGQDATDMDGAKGTELQISMLVCLIKDWNLTDDKNQVLPIKKETLLKFDLADITEIYAAYNKQMEGVKKNQTESDDKSPK